MVKHVLVCMLMVAACGGGKKGTTTPDDTSTGTQTVQNDTGASDMVSPETMDEIQRLLKRKGDAVSRCLAFAIDNKELPKSSKGKITLGISISRAGKPEDIKVIKASIESKSLTDCVLGKVREIQFPEVPKTYETTYTYGFEAS
jgi:hypothetical protein